MTPAVYLLFACQEEIHALRQQVSEQGKRIPAYETTLGKAQKRYSGTRRWQVDVCRACAHATVCVQSCWRNWTRRRKRR